MKRLTAIVLAAAMLLCLLPSAALAADSEAGLLYEPLASGGCRITGCTEAPPADLVIPAQLGGLPVTEIGVNAFADCTGLQTVRLPDTLQSVASGAFLNCGLTGVIDIPPALTYLSPDAFLGCSIMGLHFHGPVPALRTGSSTPLLLIAPQEYLEGKVFPGFSPIDERFFKDALPSTAALYEQDGMRYLIFDSFAALISGKNVFAVSIPEKVRGIPVTMILNGAFSADYFLQYIYLPDTIEYIGSSAFNDTALHSFTAPKALKYVGSSAFTFCRSLESAELGDVEYIGTNAFADCYALKTVTIGNCLRELGVNAFSGCSALTVLRLPDTLAVFGAGALNRTALTSVQLPDALTALPAHAMCNMPELRSVTMGDGIESIGDYAFADCPKLESIRLSQGLQTIGAEMFRGSRIQSLEIGPGVRDIPDDAFAGMEKLRTLSLHEGLETIGTHVFDGDGELMNLILPASVKTVGSVPDIAYAGVYYHTGTRFPLPDVLQHAVIFVNLDTDARTQIFYTFWQDGLCYLIRDCDVRLIDSQRDLLPSDLVIPDTVEGLPVTEIAPSAIRSPNVISITLPAALEELHPQFAFDCPSLRFLILPEHLRFCGVDDAESPISVSSLTGRPAPELVLIAAEGSYALDYAARMGFKSIPLPKDGGCCIVRDRHVFIIENDEATLVASYALRVVTKDIVPGSVDGFPVTRIADGAYAYVTPASNFSQVRFSEPLETIGANIVRNVPGFAQHYVFVIPASVRSIDESAFGDVGATFYVFPGSEAERQLLAQDRYCRDAWDILPFDDISMTDWYFPAVKYCYWNGLMKGTAETVFCPKGTTTRAMLVQVLWNIAGDTGEPGAPHFDDVKDTDWFSQAVNWAYANGITSGTSDTAFSPNLSVTREQVAVFLYNFAARQGRDTGRLADLTRYRDSSTISPWAMEAMQWCVAEGLINGTDAVTLSPRDTATRAQIATLLMRFMQDD